MRPSGSGFGIGIRDSARCRPVAAGRTWSAGASAPADAEHALLALAAAAERDSEHPLGAGHRAARRGAGAWTGRATAFEARRPRRAGMVDGRQVIVGSEA